jgi:hypothetical protein
MSSQDVVHAEAQLLPHRESGRRGRDIRRWGLLKCLSGPRWDWLSGDLVHWQVSGKSEMDPFRPLLDRCYNMNTAKMELACVDTGESECLSKRDSVYAMKNEREVV